jgi:cytoskeleton protein RodZ
LPPTSDHDDVAEHLILAEPLVSAESPPPVELHFGVTLRRAREQRGLSLRDVAQKTRISVRWLEALEEARLDGLPAVVFVSGYLRSYARAVGLDGPSLISRYHALLRERGEPAPSDRRIGLSRRSAAFRHGAMWLLLGALMLIVLGTLLAVAYRRGALHF